MIMHNRSALVLRVARFAYWRIPIIKVRWIARLIDCNPSNVFRIVGRWNSRVVCDKCRASIEATSRLSLREIMRQFKSMKTALAEGYFNLCKSCFARVIADRHFPKLEYEWREVQERSLQLFVKRAEAED